METNGNYYYDGAAPLRRSHILTSRVAKQPIYDPDLSVPLIVFIYSLCLVVHNQRLPTLFQPITALHAGPWDDVIP